MPHHASAAITFSLDRFYSGGQRTIHGVELMVCGVLLGQNSAALILEKDKVTDEIEKTLLLRKCLR